MRVLVVSEGKNEVDLRSESGALVEIVRPYLPTDTQIVRMEIADPLLRTNVVPGKRKGHYFKRLQRLLWYAHKEGYQGVVAVVDEDVAVKRRDGVQQANDDENFCIPRAFGLAIPTFDAWMLAEESVLSAVLRTTVGRQPELESMKKSESKQRVLTLIANCHIQIGLTELYLQVVQRMSHDLLADRCPVGFGEFRNRLMNLRAALQTASE